MADRGPHLFATDWYEDILPQLRDDAQSLGPGGLSEMPGTRMLDSLPAFQIGMKKLDTGSPRDFKTLDAEIGGAEQQFPLNTESHCVLLCDLLKRAEAAWQDGFSGLQTVFSCLLVERELGRLSGEYMDRFRVDLPAPSAEWDLNSLVQVYIWGIIRGLGLTTQIVNVSGYSVVFPEEDFHAMRYEWHFLDEVPVQTVVELLEKARKGAHQLGFDELALRLEMQNAWLTILNQKIPKKAANIHKMKELLEAWVSKLGTDDEVAFQAWFTRGVQARVNLACLKHDLVPFSFKEAHEVWRAILEAIEHVMLLNNVTRSTDLLGVLLNFSGRCELPLVRAMVKSRFTESQCLGQSTKTWVALDITETVPLPPLPKADKKQYDQFLAQANLCYVDLMTAFAMNRCRLREALSSLVVSFDSLQVSAERTDAAIPVFAALAPLSTWTMFRKLQVMMWVVLLGFETDVYSYNERACAYWYAHRLCRNLLSHLQRMRQLFEAVPNGRQSPGYSFLASLELESQMLEQLCMAELLLWMALHKMRPPEEPQHSSPESRFRLRFRMFDSVGVPELPSLPDFVEFQEQWDVKLALQGAANAAKTARTLLQTLSGLAAGNRELALLQRSAMALSVAVMKLVKVTELPRRIGYSATDYHGYFPIPEW